ncbi:unnamed protein product, partial [Urochloa humidicola]
MCVTRLGEQRGGLEDGAERQMLMEAEWIGRSGRGSSRRTKVLAQVDLGRRFQAAALFLFQGAADSKAGSTAGDANRRSGGRKSESAARIDGAEVGGANHGANQQRPWTWSSRRGRMWMDGAVCRRPPDSGAAAALFPSPLTSLTFPISQLACCTDGLQPPARYRRRLMRVGRRHTWATHGGWDATVEKTPRRLVDAKATTWRRHENN